MNNDIYIKHTLNKIAEHKVKIQELEDELEFTKRFETYGNQTVTTSIERSIKSNQADIDFLNAMIKINQDESNSL